MPNLTFTCSCPPGGVLHQQGCPFGEVTKVLFPCPSCATLRASVAALEEKVKEREGALAAYKEVLGRAETDLKSKEEELARYKDSMDAIFKDTGGHFCPEWDYLFIMPGSREYDACLCKVVGPRWPRGEG